MLLFILVEFIWLTTVRIHDENVKDEHVRKGEICVNFDRSQYSKAQRWDYGKFGHGCTCPNSMGILTLDPEACGTVQKEPAE